MCETPDVIRMGADQDGIGSCIVGVPGLEGSVRGGGHDLKGDG